MRTAKHINEMIADLLTVHQLCTLFNVSSMTISTWRRERALPTVIFMGNKHANIRFVPEEMRAWARKNGVAFDESVVKNKIKRLKLNMEAA